MTFQPTAKVYLANSYSSSNTLISNPTPQLASSSSESLEQCVKCLVFSYLFTFVQALSSRAEVANCSSELYIMCIILYALMKWVVFSPVFTERSETRDYEVM
jgi:hypothetical protein